MYIGCGVPVGYIVHAVYPVHTGYTVYTVSAVYLVHTGYTVNTVYTVYLRRYHTVYTDQHVNVEYALTHTCCRIHAVFCVCHSVCVKTVPVF